MNGHGVINMESSTGTMESPLSKGAVFRKLIRERRATFLLRGTVLQGIWAQVLALLLYTVALCVVHDLGYVDDLKLDFKPTIVPIMATVVGLLLVFRTNNAYDRYYEGRKVWSSMTQMARRLVTCIWIGVPDHGPERVVEKRIMINCVLAYPVAVKHYLREEYGYQHQDLRDLLSDLKPFAVKCAPAPMVPNANGKIGSGNGDGSSKRNIRRATRRFTALFTESEDADGADGPGHVPMEIVHCLSVYIQSVAERKVPDGETIKTMHVALTRMIDDLGSLERILRTPLPLAYSVHLAQAVWIHLLLLPLQLVPTMNWWSIVAVGITSFTLLGILQISAEIENPFGYDPNDLPLDHYCEALQKEVDMILRKDLRRREHLFYEHVPLAGVQGVKEEAKPVPTASRDDLKGAQEPKPVLGTVNEGFEPEHANVAI